MSANRSSISALPAELELPSNQQNIVETKEGAFTRIWQELDARPSKVSMITISGLCGGCKSTTAGDLAQNMQNRTSVEPLLDLAEISLNGSASTILALDYLMSVERGQEKLKFLRDGSIKSVRTQFFRVQEIIKALRVLIEGCIYETNNAYDSANNGKHTMFIQPKWTRIMPRMKPTKILSVLTINTLSRY